MTEKEKKEVLENEYTRLRQEHEIMKNVYQTELKEQMDVISFMEKDGE